MGHITPEKLQQYQNNKPIAGVGVADAVRGHLEECAGCRELLAEIQITDAAMAAALKLDADEIIWAATTDLETAVMARIQSATPSRSDRLLGLILAATAGLGISLAKVAAINLAAHLGVFTLVGGVLPNLLSSVWVFAGTFAVPAAAANVGSWLATLAALLVGIVYLHSREMKANG